MSIIKEIEDNEAWFDAEDILDEPFHEPASNDLHDEKQSHRNTTEESYNQTLCKCTSITRGEALLMTLLLGAQQSLTWTTITSILSLINTLFGENVVPETKYQLFKTLQLKDEMISYHMFCTNCLFYICTEKNSNSGDLKCAACGIENNKSNISFFLTLDMETQLKTILQDSEIQNALNDRFEGRMKKMDGNVIKNITDGEIYKKLSAANKPLSNKFNLTYTFNTDGCQASKSNEAYGYVWFMDK
ncbi:uncharacterized protein LOC123268079 [Cotesia glomerata]|uniref:uncharacterized protein LOC123268079 n=1 Tax=Cotesia glomerata TaxID=32391 RepID=UPI001D00CD52|nr:uncharacterized protein LOC123268079 [Cotesia glomerata]